jgi:hypothetical protein
LKRAHDNLETLKNTPEIYQKASSAISQGEVSIISLLKSADLIDKQAAIYAIGKLIIFYLMSKQFQSA